MCCHDEKTHFNSVRDSWKYSIQNFSNSKSVVVCRKHRSLSKTLFNSETCDVSHAGKFIRQESRRKIFYKRLSRPYRRSEGPYGRAKSWPIAASTVKYKFRNKLREPLPCPIMYSASEVLALWNMRTEEHGGERKGKEEKERKREKERGYRRRGG